MQYFIHQIQSPQLKPYVQHIIYNQYHGSEAATIRSFPNLNVTLGLISNFRLESKQGYCQAQPHSGVSVYSTGLYCKPHDFIIQKGWDEICIDFTPKGYFHFFNIPSSEKAFDLGLEEVYFQKWKLDWNRLFSSTDLLERTQIIESTLQQQLIPIEQNRLMAILDRIDFDHRIPTVNELMSSFGISERQLYRLFRDHFDITPKQYLRIARLRRAIAAYHTGGYNLTQIAYRSGYADQSHFIKESKKMLNQSPKAILSRLAKNKHGVLVEKVA